MRRKFKLKVSYTFNGCFTLRAASGKEAARLVSEQCGTVLSAIQTTLGEESEVDWHFDKHPRLAIREVIALPETLDGEKLPRVQVFHPGQRVFRSDPDYEMSGCCVVCSGNDDKETPSDKDLILICCSVSYQRAHQPSCARRWAIFTPVGVAARPPWPVSRRSGESRLPTRPMASMTSSQGIA